MDKYKIILIICTGPPLYLNKYTITSNEYDNYDKCIESGKTECDIINNYDNILWQKYFIQKNNGELIKLSNYKKNELVDNEIINDIPNPENYNENEKNRQCVCNII